MDSYYLEVVGEGHMLDDVVEIFVLANYQKLYHVDQEAVVEVVQLVVLSLRRNFVLWH